MSDWDNIEEMYTQRALFIKDYVEWTSDAENGSVASPFDFRVYAGATEGNSLSVTTSGGLAPNLIFIVEDITPEDRGFAMTGVTIYDFYRSLYALCYAPDAIIPKLDTVIPITGTLWKPASVVGIDFTPMGKDNKFWTCTVRTSFQNPAEWSALQSEAYELDPLEIEPWKKRVDIQMRPMSEPYVPLDGVAYKVEGSEKILITAYDPNMPGAGLDKSDKAVVTNSAGDLVKSVPATQRNYYTLSLTYSLPPNVNVEVNVSGGTSFAGNTLSLSLGDAEKTVNARALSFSDGLQKFEVPALTAVLNGVSVAKKGWQLKKAWLNKRKHPFGKTNAELYPDYTGPNGSDVPINKTGETIIVSDTVYYAEVQLAITVKPYGWQTAFVSKGYLELKDDGTLGDIRDKDALGRREYVLDMEGKAIRTQADAQFEAAIMTYCPYYSDDSLYNIVDAVTDAVYQPGTE